MLIVARLLQVREAHIAIVAERERAIQDKIAETVTPAINPCLMPARASATSIALTPGSQPASHTTDKGLFGRLLATRAWRSSTTG